MARNMDQRIGLGSDFIKALFGILHQSFKRNNSPWILRIDETKDIVIKDLLFEANKLNLTLNLQLFTPDEIQTANQRNLYVLTHFGGTKALAELSKILGEENVNIEMISTFKPQ